MESDNEIWGTVDASIGELEERLGLPSGFLARVRSEDDWSFVVKVHALLEAAVAHTITSALNVPNLEDWVIKLPLNGRQGKVALLSSLDEMSKFDRSFVDALSSIRNQLVHHVSNVNFQFDEYFSSLDQDRRNHLHRQLSYAYINDEGQIDLKAIEANPKKAIFDGLRLFLAILNETSGRFEAEHKLTKLRLELLDSRNSAT